MSNYNIFESCFLPQVQKCVLNNILKVPTDSSGTDLEIQDGAQDGRNYYCHHKFAPGRFNVNKKCMNICFEAEYI